MSAQSRIFAQPQLLREDLAKDVLRSHGFPISDAGLCTDAQSAAAYVRTHPAESYALKLSLDRLTHKSAVGGVRLDVSPSEVPAQVAELLQRGQELTSEYGGLHGIVVEPFVPGGTEVALGFQRDRDLGPMIMVGAGGTDIETTRDVAFAAAPVTRADAQRLVARWRSQSVLAGTALSDAQAGRIAGLVELLAGADGIAFRESCASVEVNPVLVRGAEVVAVDAVLMRADLPDDDIASCQTPVGDREGHDLSAFLDPSTIALIGATTDPGKPAHALLSNILDFGFRGTVYPVHPTASTIAGLPAYASVADIPGPVDKAIVLVGRRSVPEVIQQCVAKGVSAVQVYSSGFSEYEDARDVEGEILQALRGSTTRLVGPNCWGAYSPRSRITTNAPRFSGTESGNVAFVSQSGTHFVDVVRRSNQRSLPLYGAISAGNCLDVQVDELAGDLLGREEVEVLGLYLEGMSRARELIEVARASAKTVVVMRGGRSAQGSRAATSHTAALAGDDAVWASLMRDAGVAVVDTMEEMMDALAVAATFPRIAGDRLSVFGTGGGVAVTAADAAAARGLEITPFPADVESALVARFGAPGTSMQNPMDVTVWDMFPEGSSALSAVLSLIATPAVADSAIAYLELGSILDLNSQDTARGLVSRLVDDLCANPPEVPTSFVLRTGEDPWSEELRATVEARLRPAGVAVFTRIQDAVVAHAHRRGR